MKVDQRVGKTVELMVVLLAGVTVEMLGVQSVDMMVVLTAVM